jgi:signal transduction histidine kinase
MEETVPAADRRPDAPWLPQSWSLRSKISVVLLLPVIVALTLGGARIQTELSQAGTLSAVRDQLPVLRGTVELAELVGQEMVTAGSTPGGAPAALTSRIDAKAATVQHDADFTELSPETGRNLNIALGKLAGLRAAGTASGDALSKTAGYRDIVFALSEIVPSLISAAGSTSLDGTAGTTKLLMQQRAGLAVQETLVKSAQQLPADKSIRVAAAGAAAEGSVLGGQVLRGLPADQAARFTQATAGQANRLSTLQNAQDADRVDNLVALVPTLQSESTALGQLLDRLIGSLSDSVSSQANIARSNALRDAALVLGSLLGALAVALLVARSLVSPMRRLHTAALNAARHQLPETIKRVQAGEDVDWQSIEPVSVHTGEEIGQLARAFDDMHRQAVRLAGEQAELRKQVSEMFMTLSRRNQSLVELQLSVIEDLEADEQDPHRLEELFRIDHIATRLRRNGENLQVLAGGSPTRHGQGPIPMVELLRAATSEVKDYRRVSLGNAPHGAVRSEAAADVVHILAELLENATRFSPPEEKVVLTADRGSDGGLLVEVVDVGLGMTAEDVEAANQRLGAGAAVSPETTRRMGLFVVGRLAAPHRVTVRLRATMTRSGRAGITASVHVPGDLVIADGAPVTPRPRLEQRAPEPVAAVNGAASHRALESGHRRPRPPHHEEAEPAPTLGRVRPVPDPHSAPPMRTPIFDQLLSNWFTEVPATQSAPPSIIAAPVEKPAAKPVSKPVVKPAVKPAEITRGWVTPADEIRQAAENAVALPADTPITSSGLPTRRPGAQLAPGAAAPRKPAAAKAAGFRDPDAVRSNLARHYNGMRAARTRTGSESEPRGEGKADPR